MLYQKLSGKMKDKSRLFWTIKQQKKAAEENISRQNKL
jgi:hypothetical protein